MQMKRIMIFAAMCFAICSAGFAAQVDDYLDFLYKYMSLPDRADYPRAFYVNNVQLTLEARNEMPWGSIVPEREFRHFVLPVRVNNEHLDNCREVFYHELKPRVEGLTMSEAVLEVNHWCHEHVSYRPTDARTSSPLATIRTAYGRCGEESTLLVSALRAVGIPARQVYVPRWAHTDDNHAWVEAWADGRWHFLGACEPEPVLDLGWFNESASRAMLVHTKVFGNYDGPEEVVSRTDCYTEINVTSNYAPTSRIDVLVVDEQGHPVPEALVEFKVYNYAEFFTVASKSTDANGRASLTAGRGSLLIWASKDGKKALQQCAVGRDASATLQLSDAPLPTLRLEVQPPVASATLPLVTDAQRQENNRRMAFEDSIRRAYEATMPVEAWRGNHRVLDQFHNEAPNKVMAERLLSVISEKDLRDIEIEVLRDNMVIQTDTDDIYLRYVLNPRVENEWLTPYKARLRELMADVKSPAELVRWCKDRLRVVKEWRSPDGFLHSANPQQLRMTPLSVYSEGTTDELGRKIFFVAAARSLGWPARINEVDGTLQYYERGQWQEVVFDPAKQPAATAKSHRLELTYNIKLPFVDDPCYYTHFTLSRILDGRAQLLTYPEDATWQRDFEGGVSLSQGSYLLTSGTRLASGKVISILSPFTIDRYDVSLGIPLPKSYDELQLIGSFNAENRYRDLASGTDKTLLSTTGRGYYVLALVAPNHEPTHHMLSDLSAVKTQIEAWGRKLVLLFESDQDASRFNFDEFANLPTNVVWGVDIDGKIKREIVEQMNLSSGSLPLFVVCDTFNHVVFLRQGYTIGMGEQLLQAIELLK